VGCTDAHESARLKPKYRKYRIFVCGDRTWSLILCGWFGGRSAQITELDVALQTGIDIGDSCVQGRVEIYSCNHAWAPVLGYAYTYRYLCGVCACVFYPFVLRNKTKNRDGVNRDGVRLPTVHTRTHTDTHINSERMSPWVAAYSLKSVLGWCACVRVCVRACVPTHTQIHSHHTHTHTTHAHIHSGKLAPSEKKLANSLDTTWKDITSDLDVKIPLSLPFRVCVCFSPTLPLLLSQCWCLFDFLAF